MQGAFHDVEIVSNNAAYATVKLDGNKMRCRGYSILHSVDSLPEITLDLLAILQIKGGMSVQVGNKEEIAGLMSDEEFNEFCTIWHKMRDGGKE